MAMISISGISFPVFRYVLGSGLHVGLRLGLYTRGSRPVVTWLSHRHSRSSGMFLHTDTRCCQQAKKSTQSRGGHVVESKGEKPYGQLSTAQKVSQAGKDASYGAIILVGIGVTGAMFYMIARELFSKESSSGVYAEAYKLCKNDPDVIEFVGEPIKAYGEMTSRGRRRHVSFVEYESEGMKHMRMKFYLEGSRKKGTVHLEVQKTDSGKYDYRYLFVELEGYPSRTIVIQDKR